jgi:lipopolysaccharide transport system permease protein
LSENELVIEAGRSSSRYWRDLWHYRELLYFLAWRDVKVRYKQAAMGAAWALVQPIVTMTLFTFVFNHLAGMSSGRVPYPLLVMSGLLPWQLFSSALSASSTSLGANANLISKIYFPRLVPPLATLGVALLDFAIVFGLYLVMASWFSVWPTWRIVLLPFFTLVAITAALGGGLWLTSLTVKYRDFRFIVPFLLQFGVFATPIGFRTDVTPNWRFVLAANPMTAVIEGFRWCLLGGDYTIDPAGLAISLALITITLVTGIWYFRKTEKIVADII